MKASSRRLLASVCICSANRPHQLARCVQSLLHNRFYDYEIIIVDQSSQQIAKQNHAMLSKITLIPVRHIIHNAHNLSLARNVAIDHAQAEIIVFTDDDCVVSTNWVQKVMIVFQKNKDICGIFGKILPYKKQENMICPLVFDKRVAKRITEPHRHWDHIGFGANMAFRKDVFTKIGIYKGWLGNGSIGKSAEDAEFALRCLINRYTILYDPKILVYHNKWLTYKQMSEQNLSYISGEMACYGYFHFQGYSFATPIIWENIKNSYHQLKKLLKRVLSLRWDALTQASATEFISTLIYRIRGLFVGWLYSLADPIH